MYRIICKVDGYRENGKSNYRVINAFHNSLGNTAVHELISTYNSFEFGKTLIILIDKPYPIGSYINPRKALGI